MKFWTRVTMLVGACAMLIVFAACEGEQGPPGPAGADATDTCIAACHTDDYTMEDYIVAIQTEFDESQHNTGETYLRRGSTNSPSCSGCHTTEGYQYRIANDDAVVALDTSSRVGCFACHAPHSNANFNLRKEGVTNLYEGTEYDRGTSNTCAMCHQSRTPSPYFDGTDPITSRYWGPHHGPQGNMVAASGAYVLPGASYGTSTVHNNISDGCVGCHMAALPTNGLAGGHSFRIRYARYGTDTINSEGCGCHSPDNTFTGWVNQSQSDFEAKLSTLGDKMVALGWLEDDKAHVNTDSPPVSANDRGAVFNYLMLLDDRSLGVHHPTYMNDVLDATDSYVDGVQQP